MSSPGPQEGHQRAHLPLYPGTGGSGRSPLLSVHSGRPHPPPYGLSITDRAEQPPNYESLFGKVKAARSQSTGVGDFLKKLVLILVRTRFTILTLAVMAVPVSMTVMGGIYLHECPAQRFIPIFLLVGGCFCSSVCVVILINSCFCEKMDEEGLEEGNKCNPCIIIVGLVLLCWLVAGSYSVYKTSGRYSTNPQDHDYCDETLFKFAFWVISTIYIVSGIVFCCFVANTRYFLLRQ